MQGQAGARWSIFTIWSIVQSFVWLVVQQGRVGACWSIFWIISYARLDHTHARHDKVGDSKGAWELAWLICWIVRTWQKCARGSKLALIDRSIFRFNIKSARNIPRARNRTCKWACSFFLSVNRAIFWYDLSSRHKIVPKNRTSSKQFFLLTDWDLIDRPNLLEDNTLPLRKRSLTA